MATRNGNGTIEGGLAVCKRWARCLKLKALALLGLAALSSAAALAGISAPANSSGSYTVRWTELTGTTYYNLMESTDGGNTWTTYNAGTSLFKSFVDKPAGTYTYDVASCIRFTILGATNTVCSPAHLTQGWPYAVTKVDVPKPPKTPSVPGSLTVPKIDADGNYTVSWSASTGATSYLLQEQVGGGAWTEAHKGGAKSKTFSHKANGTYSYRVKACAGSANCSAWSAPKSVLVVSVTSRLSAQPNPSSNGSYTVSWQAVTLANSYRLHESTDGGKTWASVYEGPQLTKAFAGKADGDYAYQLDACFDLSLVGGGVICRPVDGTIEVKVAISLDAPTVTAPATDADGAYVVSWSKSAGASSYELQEWTGAGVWSSVYRGSGRSKALSGRSAGVYSYRIKACAGSTNCSAWSAEKTVRVPPPPPGSFTVPETDTDGSYTVSWSDSIGASSYELQEQIGKLGWSGAYRGSDQSKAFSGKADGAYSYRVRACAGSANCSAWSDAKSVLVSSADSGLSAQPNPSSDGSYTVSWQAVVAAHSYRLYESVDGGEIWTAVYNGTTESKTFSGKANGVYAYKLEACFNLGSLGGIVCGPIGGTLSVRVGIGLGTPAVTAPATSQTGSYEVSWSTVAKATRYELEENVNNDGWNNVYDGAGFAKSFANKANGTYHYRARACPGSANCGAWSEPKSVRVPPPAPTLTVPATDADGAYIVSWSKSAGASSYELQEWAGAGVWSTVYRGSNQSKALAGRTAGVYSYRAKACAGSANCSAWSKQESVRVPPPAPTLTAPATDADGAYVVSWSKSAGASSYELQERAGAGAWSGAYRGPDQSKAFSDKADGSYSYRVRACAGSANCSAWSDAKSVLVSGLSAQPNPSSDGSYTVSWQAVTLARGYRLHESADGGETWASAYEGRQPSKAFSGKADGVYIYKLDVCFSLGPRSGGIVCRPVDGTLEVKVAISLDPPTVTAPATDADGAYVVSWSKSAGASSYELQEWAGKGVWSTVYRGSDQSKALTGRTAGVYSYRIKACAGSANCGAWSKQKSVRVPPPAPTLTAPATDADGAYVVSWSKSAGASSYELQEWAGKGVWSTVYRGSDQSKALTGRTAGVYSYRIKACAGSANCGAWSKQKSVRVPPPAPTLTAPATDADGAYVVSWSKSAGASSYELQEWAGKGVWSTVYRGSDQSKALTGRTAGVYSYRIKACAGSANCSAWSKQESVRVPPPDPTLTAPATDADGAYVVSWSKSAGASSYELQERAGEGRWSKVYGGSGQSKALSGRTAGVYSYRAKACAGSANCSAWSELKPTRVPPPVPTLTAPATDADGNYTVSWTASAGATSYRLEERPGKGGWFSVHSGAGRSKALSGRRPGVYSYRIKACAGSANCSAWSKQKSTRVPPPLAAPTLTAPATDADGNYTVSWTASAGATSYRLEERPGKGGWSSVHSGAGRSKALSGRRPGVYSYRAKACAGSANCSAWSKQKSTRVPPPVPTLTAPATDADGNYTVSWTASAGATSYRLEERPGKGGWSSVHSGAGRSKALSGRRPEVYSYRIKACAGSANCSAWSKQKSVRVPATNPDKVATLVVEPPPAPYDAQPSLVSQRERDDTDQAGSSNGAFRVSESGAATYSVPITTFAGTAGVAPQLALSYNSQGGNGPLGLGWALDGASAISRCRATKHQDVQPKPIQWNSEDKFCLDGQRLVLENPTDVYGAVGARYRTEIDSFASIQAKGGTAGHPDYFEVRRKDGSTSYYGNTPGASHSDAKQVNGAGQTLMWAIKQFQDSVGNPIKYEYRNDADGHRIAYVRYAYDKANRSHAHVEFAYEPRKDALTGYVAGHKFAARQRLRVVRSYNENQPLREYRLEYENVGGRPDKTSRLQRIQECIRNLCLPATTFEWKISTPGFRASAAGETNLTPRSDRGVLTYQPADIDGDGNPDLVWLEWDADGSSDTDHHLKYALFDGAKLQTTTFADGTASIELYEDVDHNQNVRMRTIDYNGDGRSDVVVWRSRDPVWKVHLSQPQTDGTWRLQATPLPTSVTEKSADFSDVDGDGLVDAIYTKGDTIYAQHLRHDPGEAVGSTHYYHFGPRVRLHTMMSPKVPGIAGLHKVGNSSVTASNFDFNGDGLADFLATFTFAGPAVPTKPERVVRGPLVSNANGDWVLRKDFGLQNLHPVDLNRDGLTDLVSSETSGDDIEFHVRINNGTGFTMQTQGIRLHKDDDAFLEFMDHNGDGHPDFVWHDTNRKRIMAYLWNPETETFDTSATQILRVTDGKKTTAHLFFDVNGDGAVDYLRLRKDRLATFLSNNTGKTHNAITKITNGLGAQTKVAYETLSRTAHYDRLDLGGTATTATSCYDSVVWSECYTLPVTRVDSENIADFYTKLNGSWALPSGAQTLGKVGPVLELTGPIPVVTRVEGSAPLADDADAVSAIEYFYAEAKAQAMGRGLLGFEQLRTKDMQTGVETTTTYRQDFPFTGLPIRTRMQTSEGRLLSESTTDWRLQGYTGGWGAAARTKGTAALGAFKPYAHKVVEKSYDLNSGANDRPALLSTITTTNEYDSFGNAVRVTVTTEGGGKRFETRTANVYGPTDADRATGRLIRTDVSKRRDEDGNSNWEEESTRRSDFSYYGQQACPVSGVAVAKHAGLLCQEIVEPFKPAFRIATTHRYDTWGNRVRSKVEAGVKPNALVRCDVDTAAYDATGRYADETFDCLGRRTSKVMKRNAYGAPTEARAYTEASSSKYVAKRFAHTARGIEYFSASGDGGYTTKVRRQGGHAQCPRATALHERIRGAGGGESVRCLDKLAREVRVATRGFGGAWVRQDTEYDRLGRIRRATTPHFAGESRCERGDDRNPTPQTKCWTEMNHDILGRVVETRTPDGAKANAAHSGLAVTHTNALGQRQLETRNVLDELVRAEDHDGGAVEFAYDAQGNLTRSVRIKAPSDRSDAPAQIVTTMAYDAIGRHKVSMADADKGAWRYAHNAFGELTCQRSAAGRYTIMDYDGLGRMQARRDYGDAGAGSCAAPSGGTLEANARWTYDSAAHGLGQLARVEDRVSGYRKTLRYDRFGRPSGATTTPGAGAGEFHEKTTYDQYGRPFQSFDAALTSESQTDYGVRYAYDGHGHLLEVRDAAGTRGDDGVFRPRAVHREVVRADARGGVLEERLGGRLVRTRRFDGETGRLAALGGRLGSKALQDLHLEWNRLGNLTRREERSGGTIRNEDFAYDALNRLQWSQVRGQPKQSLTYDSYGNIQSRTGVGTYRYDPARPGAVASVVAPDGTRKPYAYDAGGNNISGGGRTLAYTAFGKTASIKRDGRETAFVHAPDRTRFKRADTDTRGRTTTTLYLGNVERTTKPDGSLEVRRHVGGSLAVHTLHYDTAGQRKGAATRYLLRDHLGGVHALVDLDGPIQAMAFGPWGQRRGAGDWTALSKPAQASASHTNITTRGFTAHEMLDAAGLVHMNGRLYDPELGRFLQADPFIQFLAHTQGHNRYSYVLNNPASLTDPSGYFVGGVAILAAQVLATHLVHKHVLSQVPLLNAVANVLACAYGGAPGCINFAVHSAYARTGSFGAALEAGVLSAVSVAAFDAVGASAAFGYGSGDGFGRLAMNALANGVVGGIANELQGGRFGHGFMSAGVGALAKPGIRAAFGVKAKGAPHRIAARAAVGGTLTAATGGKFANGAVTGAFSQAFNEEAMARGKATIRFIYKTDGLKKFQEAEEKFKVTGLFEKKFLPGEHEIKVLIDPTLEADGAGMSVPNAHTILVNPHYLVENYISVIGSAIGHELNHVNDFLRKRLTGPRRVRISEREAYNWQLERENLEHFGLESNYEFKTNLRNDMLKYQFKGLNAP